MRRRLRGDLDERCQEAFPLDWLLRIPAAPFYAEPVYFCKGGMNDQQKKQLDDLQKPFDA
jgi:hypothetical protein